MDRVHHSKLIDILQQKGADGKPREHRIQYCKKMTGELVTYERATLTSFNAKGDTVNLLVEGESTPKKLRRCLILAIDNIKIYY